MDPKDFFTQYKNPAHKQYEALRAFFVDRKTAQQVADEFGFAKTYVYTLVKRFRKHYEEDPNTNPFFVERHRGRPHGKNHQAIRDNIVQLRKQYLSADEIKTVLDTQNLSVSERHIAAILKEEGFAKLPRRTHKQRREKKLPKPIPAPKTQKLTPSKEVFVSQNAGILAFMPYIKHYGIDQLIEQSQYPATQQLSKLNAVLAFLALKLANIRRYAADDLWCMDRGMGLFAGLNVLPKASWFTAYAHRVSREMNLAFLKEMHALWHQHGLLSPTTNLDFVALPYWGEEKHLENNWSGTRQQALSSMLAALSQDPDSGLLTYGDTTVRHESEKGVVLEFLDFYRQAGGTQLQYLVFDSKFTTHQNLSKLDEQGVKFVTIRQRGKRILETLAELPKEEWKKVKVPCAHGTRCLEVNDQLVPLKGYGKKIRQIAILGQGRIKPALIITNDLKLKAADVVWKYARRWLVEKTISEQTHFFHLNRLSSSMVIKVDFDLTMTILAHNLYRLLGKNIPGSERETSQRLYDKHICNIGRIERQEDKIVARLNKKRGLPHLIAASEPYASQPIPWIGNQVLRLEGRAIT